MPEPVPEQPVQKLMEYIGAALKDATRYGLECEMLAWAFMDLCKDHEKIKAAIEHGCREWDL
jgi:hypothetical protein